MLYLSSPLNVSRILIYASFKQKPNTTRLAMLLFFHL